MSDGINDGYAYNDGASITGKAPQHQTSGDIYNNAGMPSEQQTNKHDIQIKQIGLKEAIEELLVLYRKMVQQCKETCHGDCMHEDMWFYLHCAATSFAALTLERDTFKAELETLRHRDNQLIQQLETECTALRQKLADSDIAFNFANECVGKYMADSEALTKERDAFKQQIESLGKQLLERVNSERTISLEYEYSCGAAYCYFQPNHKVENRFVRTIPVNMDVDFEGQIYGLEILDLSLEAFKKLFPNATLKLLNTLQKR